MHNLKGKIIIPFLDVLNSLVTDLQEPNAHFMDHRDEMKDDWMIMINFMICVCDQHF